MDTVDANATAEAEIRALVDDWLSAVKAGDLDGIVRHYADDIVAFDAVGRLQFTGVDTYRAHWQACLAMCDGPMTLDMRELEIVAGDDVGFARNVSRCGGTGADGVEHACWTRATVGFRRIDGRWRVVHEHRSVPFDPTSGRALLDLEP